MVSDVKILVDISSLSSGYTASTLSYTDYYPFGMPMPNRKQSMDKYRYGFNGKEFNPEWKGTEGAIYDYGFRIYDPRIAKFLSVDPHA